MLKVYQEKTNVSVRLATPGDASVMADIHVRSWEVAYKDIVPMEYIKQRNLTRIDLWQRIVTPDNDRHYLILKDNISAGIMTVAPPKDDDVDDSFYELHGIYLHPNYYRQGIGTQAVEFAFEKARSLDKSMMTVWVFEKNINSINFYKKMGFVADGKTTTHDHGEIINISIRMRSCIK